MLVVTVKHAQKKERRKKKFRFKLQFEKFIKSIKRKIIVYVNC